MSSERNAILRATLLIAFSACCFGSLTTVTLLAMRSGMSLVNVIFWRFLLAAAALFLITRKSRKAHRFDGVAFRLMAIGGIGQAIISYLSFKALDYLPVGALAFLFYTYPAWVAIISAFRGKDILNKSRITALALAMAGITAMVGAPSSTTLSVTGIVMALATAILYAIYLPMIHDAQKQLPAMLSSFYIISGIALSFAVVSIITRHAALPSTGISWAYVAILALVGTVLAFGGLMSGLRTLGPVRTSIISTVEPFFTAVLGAALLGQGLTAAVVVGGVMIAGAVVILEQSSAREELAV
jgi:drug/metabolite transporter (DMT)-like permease